MNKETINFLNNIDFENNDVVYKKIVSLFEENQKLKEAINKAIKEKETGYFIDGDEEYSYLETWFGVETLLNILKEVE